VAAIAYIALPVPLAWPQVTVVEIMVITEIFASLGYYAAQRVPYLRFEITPIFNPKFGAHYYLSTLSDPRRAQISHT